MLWGARYGGGEVVDYTGYRVQGTFCCLFLFPTFCQLYQDQKRQIGFLFKSHHCHFYSLRQSSTIKPILLLLVILVRYNCTVCIVCHICNLTKDR
jgi:hypothetical protein